MPEVKKGTRSDVVDAALEVAGYTPDVLYAKEAAMAKGLSGIGKKASAAKASSAALKKVLAPVEAATYAVEALRLATDGDLRDKRIEQVAESAKDGAAERMFDAWSNPIGTIYGAGQTMVDTAKINFGEAGREEEFEREKARIGAQTEERRALRAEAARQLEEESRRALDAPSAAEKVRMAQIEDRMEQENARGMVRSYLEGQGLV